MRVLAAIPLVLLPLASAAGAPPTAGRRAAPYDGEIRICDAGRRGRLTEGSGTVRAQRLIDLPPGNLDLAVVRSIDGPEPVTIRENFGAVGGPRAVKRAEPPARPEARLPRC